jgi:hypothetical protein
MNVFRAFSLLYYTPKTSSRDSGLQQNLSCVCVCVGGGGGYCQVRWDADYCLLYSYVFQTHTDVASEFFAWGSQMCTWELIL